MPTEKKWYPIAGRAWTCAGEGFMEQIAWSADKRSTTVGNGFRVELLLTEDEAELLYNDLMYRYEVRNDVMSCFYDMHYACKDAAVKVLDILTEPEESS